MKERQKAHFGVVVTPPITYSPYLSELYGRLSGAITIFQLMELTLQFLRLVRLRKKARIIHIHWLEYLYRHRVYKIRLLNITVPYLLLTCKFLGYKIVVTMHNIRPHEPMLVDSPMFKISLNLSDKIIVHNRFCAQETFRIYGANLRQKITIIRHGNFVSYFPNDISKPEARRRLGLESDQFVFLVFGNLRPYKGLEEVIEAFKMASQTARKIVLMIVGRPITKKYEDFIRSRVQELDNCVFKSEFVPDNEVQLYLNAADIGILNYKKVSTPGTLFLFMSFGRPVIVSDVPSVGEFESEDFCIFFKPNDVRSLHKAIMKAYNRKDEMREIGIRAFQKAQLFDWESISRKTLELYISSLKR